MANRRALQLLCLCQALLAAGHTISFPFFALYLTRIRGLGPGPAGLFLAASLLGSAAGFALGGEISDSIGRVRVMLGSLVLRALGAAAIAWALWRNWPVLALFLLHSSAGFVGNTFPSASRSWIADRFPPRERVEAYGWLRMAVNLGWAAGPALGGGIAEVSYQAMFVISAGVFLACAFFLRLALDADEAQRPGEGFSARALIDPASDRRFLAFTLCVLALASVMAQLVAPLSMHASLHGGLSESRIGLLFSLNGLLVVACQWPAARLIGRLRLSSALVLGCALYALGYGSVGFARGLPAFALCVLVFTLGEVMASPALQALSANLAPAGRKGRYMGFCGLMEQVGMAAGPLLGGLLQQWLGRSCPAAPWLCVAGAALAAGAGFSALGGRLSLGEQGLSEMPSEREFIAAGAGADGA